MAGEQTTKPAGQAWQDHVCTTLRSRYAEQAELPQRDDDHDDPETLTLARLQRLFRHALTEGYGL